jgi:hypothetical protein
MKGLDPLIAITTLIALLIVIGAIIFAWNQGLLKELLLTIGKSAEQLLFCSNARVELLSVELKQSNLTGKILNSGNVELRNIRIRLISSNQTKVIGLCGTEDATECEEASLILSPGKVVSFNVEPSDKPDTISILTNCPNTFDSVKFSDICLENTKSCSSNWQCCSGYCKTDFDNVPEAPSGWCCNPDQCAHDGVCYENGYETPHGYRQPFWRCVDGIWNLRFY